MFEIILLVTFISVIILFLLVMVIMLDKITEEEISALDEDWWKEETK